MFAAIKKGWSKLSGKSTATEKVEKVEKEATKHRRLPTAEEYPIRIAVFGNESLLSVYFFRNADEVKNEFVTTGETDYNSMYLPYSTALSTPVNPSKPNGARKASAYLGGRGSSRYMIEELCAGISAAMVITDDCTYDYSPHYVMSHIKKSVPIVFTSTTCKNMDEIKAKFVKVDIPKPEELNTPLAEDATEEAKAERKKTQAAYDNAVSIEDYRASSYKNFFDPINAAMDKWAADGETVIVEFMTPETALKSGASWFAGQLTASDTIKELDASFTSMIKNHIVDLILPNISAKEKEIAAQELEKQLEKQEKEKDLSDRIILTY